MQSAQEIIRLTMKVRKLEARVQELEAICASTYQAVGSMSSDLGQFGNPHVLKVLDNLGQARLLHEDVLPFPSFEQAPQ